jgi:hypothetical protein
MGVCNIKRKGLLFSDRSATIPKTDKSTHFCKRNYVVIFYLPNT